MVLGCQIGERGTLSAAAERRVNRAVAAYHHARSSAGTPVLVLSGGRRWHGVAEAEAFRRCVIEQGVPEASTMRELRSLTTLENAVYSTGLLRELGLANAGIVTCDWHIPRALRCFEGRGIRLEAIPAASPAPRSQITKWGRNLLEHGRSRFW